MAFMGLAGAGMMAYVLMNKKTKKEADRLINTVLREADQKIKEM